MSYLAPLNYDRFFKTIAKKGKGVILMSYLAPLNYDRFFRKIFKDTKIAKAFLEDFLNEKIDSITKLSDKHRLTD